MKIIILDDSMTVRMILESLLEELDVNEDEIFSFEHGHEALEFIKSNGADIIFSDINMPQMSGHEFATEVFKILPKIKSRFFAVSGDETKDGINSMKQSGVHRFVKKPVHMEYFNHFVKPEILKIRNK